MNDGTADRLKVSFPASPVFDRVGRVAVGGLGLRLGIDIVDVERLRQAVDRAVTALHGQGRITLLFDWQPQRLTITVGNPDETIDAATSAEVAAAVADMVDRVSIGPSAIDLMVDAAASNGHRA